MQRDLEDLEPTKSSDWAKSKKRPGPPNRMNDLPYREWMKFQKSFFRDSGTADLIAEYVHFFTKETWPDGRISRSLLLIDDDVNLDSISKQREVDHTVVSSSYEAAFDALCSTEHTYDFVLVDLRSAIQTVPQLDEFLQNAGERFFSSLRRLLYDERYCCVLTSLPRSDGTGFPLPWSIAYAGRGALRLRDEKIGINTLDGSAFYSLIFQATDDGRGPKTITESDLVVGSESRTIPAWVIPKPPPRSKDEVLHPAKFPETLVVDFIELFAPAGGVVFDPMAGTGSTVVAALQCNRSGIGIELSDEYAAIAKRRVDAVLAPQLFADLQPQGGGSIICADARELASIPELADVEIDYVITSPPYWSMLQNKGSENQRNRREKNLALVYSEDERDTGNITSYEDFLETLIAIYEAVANKMSSGSIMTIVVKNVKRDHIIYPLGWDLVLELCRPDGRFEFIGNTFWCQDDIGLKPFAVGIHWVSNTLHQYCLHVRRK